MELHLPPECLPEVSTPNSLTWSITNINFSLNANFVPLFPSTCAANASPTSMSMSMTRKHAEIKGPSGTLAPRFCHSSCRCSNGKSKCGAALQDSTAPAGPRPALHGLGLRRYQGIHLIHSQTKSLHPGQLRTSRLLHRSVREHELYPFSRCSPFLYKLADNERRQYQVASRAASTCTRAHMAKG
jgi:hypothetical protein